MADDLKRGNIYGIFEYQVVIKFLYLKRETNDDIVAELDFIYGDCTSISAIKNCITKFKYGHRNIFSEECNGYPNDVTAQKELVQKSIKFNSIKWIQWKCAT